MKRVFLPLIATVALSSCQEKNKPEDVLKYEEQEKELAALEVQLDELRKQLAKEKTDPPKVPVAELQKQLDEKNASLKKLNDELGTLKKSEKEAKERLEDYQSRYRLPE